MNHGKNNRVPADKAKRPQPDNKDASATPPEDPEALRKRILARVGELDDVGVLVLDKKIQDIMKKYGD